MRVSLTCLFTLYLIYLIDLVNTHVHADHITGSGLIKKKTNFEVKSILSKDTKGLADIHVKDGKS